ncbi:hypothetical protein TOPH_01526 [Tolypocladium ophioglossoides CBS 100239]|uniref:Heme-binding protein HMX1 n=1 Tax=Tolypocladium ophioglossoides (strain CBS 100239) TaxID=1163406 RepID=A0A0L0NH42_TOLOC|nr:hypothetical protein TOPH_01526 [Tolypocladium ophioglossoides CBS 100239]
MDSFREGRPLVESIAIATRSIHARLNKLIIARLPLALPPRAADPAPYLSGLLHIAPIYTTFEEAWRDILDAPPRTASIGSLPDGCDPEIPLLDTGSVLLPKNEDPRLHRSSVCGRMHSMLEYLYLPGLMRSDRLREDIREMTGWPDHVVEEQLQTISKTGYLSEFTSHIRRAVMNKPHVLLAYSYIMFMALFAGGRFIRASLESAGEQFWVAEPASVKPTTRASQRTAATGGELDANSALNFMPLHFFHFDTPLDGEDLRREYKQRLSDSEEMLTPREKHNIVQEAVCIFENVTLLVSQLDMVCAELAENDHVSERADSLASLAGLLENPHGYRFRDSVAITKERRERRPSKRSSGHEDNCSIARAIKTRQSSTSSTHGSANASQAALTPQPDEHRPLPSLDGIELCPAMSKSIRFDRALPRPARSQQGSHDSGSELAGGRNMASKRLQGANLTANLTHWVLVAAFGVMFLGAVLAGRRGVIEG